MKYILRIGLMLVIILSGCKAKNQMANSNEKIQTEKPKEKPIYEFTYTMVKEILVGADDSQKYLPILKNKKIGVLTNQSGVLKNGTHLVDFLISNKINIQSIFAPEHGFRGIADAGEHIIDGKDAKTGLPIISLYGDNKKPKPEQLLGIEIMIFDLQDVGARFYTYISSLHYLMEACAENNIQLLILDRPNPNGNIIDGSILEKQFQSFVGMHQIPILHGMTIGEYAQMINGEKWLKNGIKCQLEIIKCKNYKHSSIYDLPVKPSPNLPNSQAVNLYASLCLFEGTNVSVGRGTEQQFQVYGAPTLANNGFQFIPIPNFGAKEPLYKNQICHGEDLSKINKIDKLELKWLINAYIKPKINQNFSILFLQNYQEQKNYNNKLKQEYRKLKSEILGKMDY